MGLHRKTVFLDAQIPHLYLTEKTEAGHRRVPIHPAILGIIRRRFRQPTQDGYLFQGGTNKIDSRGARLTNPLRRLLDSQKIGRGFGFHSFRRTFVDMLMQADVAELYAARIVGHAVKTLTYGLYASQRMPLDRAQNIMEACIQYPASPDF